MEDFDVAGNLGDTTHVPVELVEHITLACVRYEQSQSLGDLDDLLDLWRAILEFTETDGVLTPAKVHSLATRALLAIYVGLEHRTKLAGDDAYLDERIDALRRLSNFADSQTYIALLLGLMGMLLCTRYDLQSNAEDLDSSIVALRRAFHLNPDEPRWVRCLIVALDTRRLAFSRLDDVDEVIKLTRVALEDTSDNASALDDRDLFTEVHEARQFGRFSQSRDVADLDNFLTISRMQQTGWARALALRARYHDSGEPSDLDLAIGHYESQLDRDLTRTDRLGVLYDLSRAYTSRFHRSHSLLKSDLYNAIACETEAIAMLDSDDPDYLKHAVQLANTSTIRAHINSDVEDLDKATELFRSVLFRSGRRPEEIDPLRYIDYVHCLYCRGQMLDDSSAVRESITLLEECARRMPASDSRKAGLLWALAESRDLALTLDIKQCAAGNLNSLRHRAKEMVLAFADAANATADSKDVRFTATFII